MKSRIIIFIITILTVNSLSVVYGDEIRTLTSLKYATTISEANAVLHLASRDIRIKKQLKNEAKYVYRQAKRSKDSTLINGAYRAYLKAIKQEKSAVIAYEKAKEIESSLKENLVQKFKASTLSVSTPQSAKQYLEYALSIDKNYEEQTVFGYIANLFDVDLIASISFVKGDDSRKTPMEFAANQTKGLDLTVMAHKTIFQW